MPENDRHIGFENDNLVERRLFEICDTSLFGFSFKLDIENTMNVVDLVPFAETENSKVYAWDITSGAIGKGGIVKTQIRAFDESGERVWHSEWIDFVANESINASKELDDERIISEFEQLEMRVQTAVSTAEASAQNALNDSQNALNSSKKAEEYFLAAKNCFEQAEKHSSDAKEAAESINAITIDTTLDENSSNPVENKVISSEILKINENIGNIDKALNEIIELQESFI